jgi:DNA-directed RNA polymerase specialized sigma24 family protein
MNDNTTELLKYTKALVLLQLQALNKSDESLKPEILLSRVGLSAKEIAEMIGKNPAAVTKALQRAGKRGI